MERLVEHHSRPTDQAERPASGGAWRPRWRRRLRRPGPAWLVPVALRATLALPLVVALVVLRHPRWYPLLDLAITELRIRDVAGHLPLVGLPGRFDGLDTAGSHLGPVSFWTLAPLYRLFGADGWALQAATATLNLVAMAGAVWIGHRRGGLRGALAVTVGLAVLVRVYEAERLTEAWNPYLPMMWWFLFLLAVWSVLCTDVALLPVAVFAGSFCAQTHVPYVGQVGGLGALVAVAGAAWLWRRRHDPAARSRLLRWGGGATALLVALWLPPFIEQVTGNPGNVSVVVDTFRHPTDPPVGVGTALEAWLARLDVGTLVSRDLRVEGSPLPGLLLLAAWSTAAVASRRLPDPNLRRLHVVVAAALVLGLVSMLRVTGTLWDYLVLWASGTTVLALGATGWTAVTGVRARAARTPARADATNRWASRWTGRWTGGRAPAGVTGALVAVLMATTASATYDAAHAQAPQPGLSEVNRHLLPPLVEALEDGTAPGGGRDGRYLVTWADALTPGLNGYTFLAELERQGFQVGMDEAQRVAARPHRVLDREDATATITYVAGPYVERWRDRPDAVLVAEHEPPAADRERYAELRRQVVAELRAAGLDHLVGSLDENVLGTATHAGVPASTRELMGEMIELGLPAAVFVTPGRGAERPGGVH